MRYIAVLKNFEYPLQSVLFYLALLYVVLFFDANSIVQYSLAVTCIVLTCLHPSSSLYARDLVSYLYSNEKMKALEAALHLT
jgi:hypothetical protein